MRKIINFKAYDTETAKPICTKAHYATKNFTTMVIASFETVYQKTNGEYFLYHEPTGEHMYDQQYTIKPLTDEEALLLCQDMMDGEDYEARFGEVDE